MFGQIPLTGLTTGFACLVMIWSWFYLGQKIRQAKLANTDTLSSLKYLRAFFLHMGIFTAFMSAPLFWLPVSPAAFSTAMAYGYVIGHIFLYVAVANISLMICTVVPRLSSQKRVATIFWVVAALVMTAINAKTMIWGIQPIFNTANNVTEFRAANIVGVGIALLCLLAFLPAAILFAISAVKGQGASRVKSLLMAVGIVVIMIGGPMHDLARTANAYALADAIYIVGTIIFGLGIAYKVEKAFTPAASRSSMKTASSNTV